MSVMAWETRCRTETTDFVPEADASTLLEISRVDCILLFDRRRDAGSELLDLLHAADNIADGANGTLRRGLYCRDLGGDIIRRLRGLHGQRFDFGRDDGKSLTGALPRAASIVALRASKFVCRATP